MNRLEWRVSKDFANPTSDRNRQVARITQIVGIAAGNAPAQKFPAQCPPGILRQHVEEASELRAHTNPLAVAVSDATVKRPTITFDRNVGGNPIATGVAQVHDNLISPVVRSFVGMVSVNVPAVTVCEPNVNTATPLPAVLLEL